MTIFEDDLEGVGEMVFSLGFSMSSRWNRGDFFGSSFPLGDLGNSAEDWGEMFFGSLLLFRSLEAGVSFGSWSLGLGSLTGFDLLFLDFLSVLFFFEMSTELCSRVSASLWKSKTGIPLS